MAGHDDDRQAAPSVPAAGAQLQAVHLRHANVGHDAAAPDFREDLQESRRAERMNAHGEARGAQAGRPSDWRTASSSSITCTTAISWHAATSSSRAAAQGEAKNRTARRRLASTQICPPCASTIVREIDRPNAHALALGGDEGLEQLLARPPAPDAARRYRRRSTSHQRRRNSAPVVITSRRALDDSAMASMALRIRLSSTCWIWTLSASTRSALGSSRNEHVDPVLPGADQGQRAGLLDQLRQALDPSLGSRRGPRIRAAAG